MTALATLMDFLHVAAMVVWALGLPLLIWHRWPRLSFAYTVYAISFVVLSQGSHFLWGECLLTTWSRDLWAIAGVQADGTFTGRLVNFVAGIRPSAESVVYAWQAAIVVTSVAAAWSLYRGLRRRRAPSAPCTPCETR